MAVNSVRDSQVRFGDAVAVVGLGAIGLLTVKVAALAGADVIFAVDPLPKRRKLAQDYGAHHVIDPFAGDAALEIKEMTGGAGLMWRLKSAGITRRWIRRYARRVSAERSARPALLQAMRPSCGWGASF